MVRIFWSGSRTRIRIRYHWDYERKWYEKDGDDDDAKDFDDNVITARKMMMMITMMMISLTKIIAIMLSGLAPVG